MDLLPADRRRLEAGPAELLARDARPAERAALAEALHGLGWCRHDLDAWESGAPAAVVYDPVDARIRAAGLARQVAPGTFELLIGAVGDELADRAALGERLIRALGDRLRRLGGVRLLADMDRSGLPAEDLAAAGFRSTPPVAGLGAHAGATLGCLEL